MQLNVFALTGDWRVEKNRNEKRKNKNIQTFQSVHRIKIP